MRTIDPWHEFTPRAAECGGQALAKSPIHQQNTIAILLRITLHYARMPGGRAIPAGTCPGMRHTAITTD